MKGLLFLLVLFLPSGIRLEKQISFYQKKLFVDHLGNFYALDGNNLSAIKEDGSVAASFLDGKQGALSYVDVSDPLRIMLLYSDFNTLLFIDNKLAPIGSPIHLDDFNISETSVSCTSPHEGFWVYDNVNQQLVHFNRYMQSDMRGTLLNSYLKEEENPVALLERNDRIYLYFPAEGIVVSDRYGTYIKIIPEKNIADIQVYNDRLYFRRDQKMYSIDLKYNAYDSILIPVDSGIESVYLNNGKILVHNDTLVSIFEIIP